MNGEPYKEKKKNAVVVEAVSCGGEFPLNYLYICAKTWCHYHPCKTGAVAASSSSASTYRLRYVFTQLKPSSILIFFSQICAQEKEAKKEHTISLSVAHTHSQHQHSFHSPESILLLHLFLNVYLDQNNRLFSYFSSHIDVDVGRIYLVVGGTLLLLFLLTFFSLVSCRVALLLSFSSCVP